MERAMNKILFKFPTRSRFEIFKSTLDLYYKLLSNKHKYQFIITLDNDDEQMNSSEARSYLNSKPNLKYYYGDSKSKIEAVNADMDKADPWSVCVLLSDDMIPQIQGYDDIIVNKMKEHFPNNDGVLWFDDGYLGKNNLITLSIVGKNYYDIDGHIYHPAFRSLWCDNYQLFLAQKRNKIIYIPQTIIKHEWMRVTGNDNLHKINSAPGIYETEKCTYDNLVRKFNESGDINMAKQTKQTKQTEVIEQPKTPTEPSVTNYKLSILICHTKDRSVLLNNLLNNLNKQVLNKPVEFLIDDTDNITIGKKRNILLNKAIGIYTVFIDDDDNVASDYVERILNAIESNPDTVAFYGNYYINGKFIKRFYHSIENKEWSETPDTYLRCPNHLNPIKRELALKVLFPEISFGEDKDFSYRILPLLKTEAKLTSDPLYHYYKVKSNIINKNKLATPTLVNKV